MGHHQEVHHEVHKQAAHQPDQLHQAEHQATQAFQSCVNEARVLTCGGFNGMVKDAQKEWKEHPLQVVGEAAGSLAGGFVVGAATVAAAPEVVAGITAIGAVGLGFIAYDQAFNHGARNEKVLNALKDAGKPGQSEAQIQKDMKVIEEQLGADIFHGALIAATSGAGGAAGAMWKTAEIAAAKEAMNVSLAQNARNGARSVDQMERFINKDYNALRNGGLSNTLHQQPSLKFEPNNRPPETPQGLHHIVIEGHEGH